MRSSRSAAARLAPLLLALAIVGGLPACRSVTRSSILGPGEPTAPVGQLVRLPTRPRVFVSYLVLAESPRPPPEAIAVMLPGAGGVTHLDRLPGVAAASASGDFLFRAREQLVSRKLGVVVIDAPTDRPGGMDDAFRTGDLHARDVEAVLEHVNARFPNASLYLVGADRGAISAAHLSIRLQPLVQGVVLVSTPLRPNVAGLGLAGFDWTRIPVPLLFVHHVADECRASPYEDALRLEAQYRLIAISGGSQPDSGPCDPLSAHGLYGREQQAAQEIRSWILGDHAPPGPAVTPTAPASAG